MSANAYSQDRSPDLRLAETASILAKVLSQRRREVNSFQRVTSPQSTVSGLAIFSETSVSVPVPVGEEPEIGDES